MGLLDVLNGMQNGPRGQRTPAPTSTGSGTSPIAMAIMGLLAYKAVKHLGGSQPSPGSIGPAALPVRRAAVSAICSKVGRAVCSRAALAGVY